MKSSVALSRTEFSKIEAPSPAELPMGLRGGCSGEQTTDASQADNALRSILLTQEDIFFTRLIVKFGYPRISSRVTKQEPQVMENGHAHYSGSFTIRN